MLDSARLYLVTGVRPDLADFLRAAVAGGVDAVQIRERAVPDRDLLAALELVRDVTTELGIPLVVNDRADLALLARAAGRVLSRDQLLDALKGEEYEAFDRSIDVHISKLRAKLEHNPKAPRYIKTVRGLGYVFLRGADGG